MKIVRIIARLNVGGPARHVTWLTEALGGDGFETVLVAGTVPEGENDMGYFAEARGVCPVYVKEMSRELSFRDAVSFWKVLAILRRERPDIVHTHTAKAGTVGRVAGLVYRLLSGRRVMLVHTYHGHVFHSYYGRAVTGFFLAVERLLARFATDRIVVISEQQRQEISGGFKVGLPSQFEVIGLGADLSEFEAYEESRRRFREEVGAGGDTFVVGFVGRITEIKNLPMLVGTADLLRRTGRAGNLLFAIVGDGAMRAGVEAEASRLGVRDMFVFVGHRAAPAQCYPGFDAVVLTSLNEGTPLSLIEAMAAGKPVISTAVGGVVDLVGPEVGRGDGFRTHERGLTVDSGDLDGLAAGIARLASDGPLRESVAKAARAFVKAGYSKERLVADIKRLYLELCGPRP